MKEIAWSGQIKSSRLVVVSPEDDLGINGTR